MKGFVEFEFDLPEALLTNLVRVFDNMDAATFTQANVEQIADAQGVYQLLHNDELVYIGKTDAEAGLRKRLERHARTIRHRSNLDPSLVTFKAVRVFVFTAIDLETQLIRHYGKSAASWNLSGFGSNDPGRERDTTNVKPEGFDGQYPIDIDRALDVEFTSMTADQATKLLKQVAPYTVRIEAEKQGGRRPHPDFLSAHVDFGPPPYTTRMVMLAILDALPEGWQATAFPGRIIMYKEDQSYTHGTVIGRSNSGRKRT